MPDVLFSHPDIPDALTVTTGANQISWSYVLNTQSFPTKGGEVVQILSTHIDNLVIQGHCRSYAEMEGIYRWFLSYIQIATQGIGGLSYVEHPVTMTYPHRGWVIGIKPVSLPRMRYARDLAASEWQLQAFIVNPDPAQVELTTDQGVGSLVGGELENWEGRISADIGYRIRNPFSDPNGYITRQERDLYGKTAGQHVEGEDTDKDMAEADAAAVVKNLKGHAKQMHEWFQALVQGKLEDVPGSKPLNPVTNLSTLPESKPARPGK